jgi:nitrite reductase (NADH) large subunit
LFAAFEIKTSGMKIVVIGNGMVGYKFCEKIIARSKGNQFHLTVFGEEPRPAYDRVHLSEYFSGKTAEDLTLALPSWYKENHIALYIGDPVQQIDRLNKTV